MALPYSQSPFPPCGGRLGWGVPSHERSGKIKKALGPSQCSFRCSCGGTPHPASPKLASLAKAPHPSPTRGEEALLPEIGSKIIAPGSTPPSVGGRLPRGG